MSYRLNRYLRRGHRPRPAYEVEEVTVSETGSRRVSVGDGTTGKVMWAKGTNQMFDVLLEMNCVINIIK